MDSAIVKLPACVAAYGKRDLRMDDLTLDDIGLEKHCPLDDGHFTTLTITEPDRPRKRQKRAKPSTTGPSTLERLPLEISSLVFLLLDIPTIISTRRVSRRIMAAIDSLYPYRQIRTHCPDVFRAAVGISARSFNLATLYETLQKPVCEQCGESCDGSGKRDKKDKDDKGDKNDETRMKTGRLAGYLYLVTCTRVCYECFMLHLDFFPVSLAQASKALGMPKAKILTDNEQYPHMRTIPGHYSWWKKIEKKSTVLVDRAAVRRVVQLLPATDSTVSQAARNTIFKPKQDQKNTEVWRHVAIVSVPYFAPFRQAQSVDWGFHCVLCKGCKEPDTHFRLKYTRDGLMQHLMEQHDLTASE